MNFTKLISVPSPINDYNYIDVDQQDISAEEISVEWCDHCVVIVDIAKTVPLGYALPLYGFLMPILVLLTTSTNIFVIIVLSRKHLRTPTNFILISMAVVDLLTGLTSLPWFIYYYTLHGYEIDGQFGLNEFWCKIYPHLSYILPTIWHTTRIWLTVFLIIQRYVYVCVPNLLHTLCTPQRTHLAVFLIACFSLVTEMPDLFGKFMERVNVHDRGACTLRHADWVYNIIGIQLFYSFIYWFRVAFVHIIPCLLITIFTLKLANIIKRSAQRRRSLVNVVNSEYGSVSNSTHSIKKCSRNSDNRFYYYTKPGNSRKSRCNSNMEQTNYLNFPSTTTFHECTKYRFPPLQNSTVSSPKEDKFLFSSENLLKYKQNKETNLLSVRTTGKSKEKDIEKTITVLAHETDKHNNKKLIERGKNSLKRFEMKEINENYIQQDATLAKSVITWRRVEITINGNSYAEKFASAISSSSSGRSFNATNRMLAAICFVFLLLEVPAALIFTLHFLIATRYLHNVSDGAYAILNVALIIRNILIVLTSPLQFFIYCSMSERFRLTVRQLFSSRLLFVAQAQTTFHGGKRYSLILVDVDLIQQQKQRGDLHNFTSRTHNNIRINNCSSPNFTQRDNKHLQSSKKENYDKFSREVRYLTQIIHNKVDCSTSFIYQQLFNISLGVRRLLVTFWKLRQRIVPRRSIRWNFTRFFVDAKVDIPQSSLIKRNHALGNNIIRLPSDEYISRSKSFVDK